MNVVNVPHMEWFMLCMRDVHELCECPSYGVVHDGCP